MHTDTPILARIYSEAVNQLDSFSRRVQEGRDVEHASSFARWLSFSGIIMLLERYPNQVASHDPLKVDGSFLRWKCEQLIEACNLRFRTNNLNPSFEKKEFESMHEKIDRMAGYLSRLSVAPAVVVSPLPAADLQIISGGLDERLHNESPPMPPLETVNQRP
jgi:hypothetical protein